MATPDQVKQAVYAAKRAAHTLPRLIVPPPEPDEPDEPEPESPG